MDNIVSVCDMNGLRISKGAMVLDHYGNSGIFLGSKNNRVLVKFPKQSTDIIELPASAVNLSISKSV